MPEPIFHIDHPAGARRSDLRKEAIKHMEDAVFLSIGANTSNPDPVVGALHAAQAKIEALLAELQAK